MNSAPFLFIYSLFAFLGRKSSSAVAASSTAVTAKPPSKPKLPPFISDFSVVLATSTEVCDSIPLTCTPKICP